MAMPKILGVVVTNIMQWKRTLLGKSLLDWSILAAENSKYISKTIIEAGDPMIIDSKGYDIIAFLHSNMPCRINNLLDKCIEKFISGGHDSLFTAEKHTPFFWQKINNKWEYINKGNPCNRQMRQDLKEDEYCYFKNNNIHIISPNLIEETEDGIGKNPCVFETKEMNNLEIDVEQDFRLIEAMAKEYNLKSLV